MGTPWVRNTLRGEGRNSTFKWNVSYLEEKTMDKLRERWKR